MRSILLIFIAFIWTVECIALEQERVALVVGNAAYENVSNLSNPANDAGEVARALERLGFKVIVGIDLSHTGFVDKIKEFSRSMRGAEIALFYYAGHGLQVGGQNYLAPVDAELKDEADLEFGTVRLQAIISQMEREQRTSIILLDACRDNPLARNLARAMGTRSTASLRGLAPVETGVGTLIAYSTQPGNVAYDGNDVHSPFTGALLRYIETPGEDLAVILRHVRRDVLNETKGVQVPWSNSSLTGPVVLSAVSNTQVGDTDAIDLAYWESIRNDTRVEYFKNYLSRFPDGNFSDLARLKVAALGGQQSEGSNSNEHAAGGLLTTYAGEFSGVGAAIEFYKTEEEISGSTELSSEKTTVLALANPAQTAEEPRELSGTALVRSIQTELNRVGCAVGNADGVWGKNSQNGLKRFSIYAKANLKSLDASQQVLALLKDKSFRVCPLDCPSGYVATANKCYKKTVPRTSKQKPHRTKYGKCVSEHRWYTSYLEECK